LEARCAWDAAAEDPNLGFNLWIWTVDLPKADAKIIEMFPEESLVPLSAASFCPSESGMISMWRLSLEVMAIDFTSWHISSSDGDGLLIGRGEDAADLRGIG
jgi:hypothetical protein